MNTEHLQPLAGRWPNDAIVTKKQPSLQDAVAMLSTPRTRNIYQDQLAIDPQDSKFIADFAAQNNLAYSQFGSIKPEQYGDAIPAWLGVQTSATQPIFAHEITGRLYGYDTTFFLAYAPASVQTNDSVDSKTERLRLSQKSIIRVKLPEVFPQMVLDSNKNDRGLSSTIPASFEDSQKVTLEGNFAEYFDFYAPVGLQINTLTVLAPNFMQIIMDSAATFDVEFYGNELVLVTKDPIYTPEVMATTLRALEAQLTYLDRLLPSWNYTPVKPPFDLLHKTLFDGTVVKVGKLRVKPAMLLTLILLGLALYGIVIFILKTANILK